jgi:hypothetical protein
VRGPSLRAAVLAALLAAAAGAAAAASEPGAVSLAVSGSTGSTHVTAESVAARLASYVNAWYGGVLEVVATGGRASVRVTLAPDGGGISARTEMTRGTARASRTTTLPAGSLASLLPVLACDMAYLWSLSESFANLPLSPPPRPAARLSTDTLAWLTGWNPEDLEPLGITGSDGSVTVTFPHGWITLGPLFSLSTDTVRDLLAQGLGREPLQLSAAVRLRDSSLALLSEREGKIAWIDTRLGTRFVRDAPGLAAGRAERLGPGAVAVLSPAGVSAWSEDGSPPDAPAGRAPAPRQVGRVSGIASAFTIDAEGNAWVYDTGQARVRVFSPQGREVFSVRPVARSPALQFPQQIAVLDDGSFLLGGAGELWKFRNTGIPVWKLDRIAGQVAEALPATFQLAVDRRSGGFVLLDGPSRRLLAFAADRAAALAAGGPPGGDGLLLALQEADREGLPDDAGDALTGARLALLRKKASLLAEVAAAFQSEFLAAQEENALLRAAEAAREVLAGDPADPEASRLLEAVTAGRRRVRASLAQEPAVLVVAARGIPRQAGQRLDVQLRLRSTRAVPLARIRLGVIAPGLSLMPSLVEAGPFPPGGEQAVELALPLEEPFELPGPAVQASALVTWERDPEGGAAPARFVIEVNRPGPGEAAASLPARLAACSDPDDQLLRSVLAEVTAGAEDRFAAAAAALDSLGRARQSSPGTAGPPLPRRLAARGALRALSEDPVEWCLVTADVLSALGFPVGFLALPAGPVVLVDTGMPMADALARVPALARDRDLLATLSRNGSLCVPLSGRVLPAPSPLSPSGFALAEGLRACREKGAGPAAWLPAAGTAGRSVPVPPPFPLRLPVVTERLDRDTLASRIQSELEKHR